MESWQLEREGFRGEKDGEPEQVESVRREAERWGQREGERLKMKNSGKEERGSIMKDINSIPLHWWPAIFARLKHHRWVSDSYTGQNIKHSQVQVFCIVGSITPMNLCSALMRVCMENHNYSTSCVICLIIKLNWQTNKPASNAGSDGQRGALHGKHNHLFL